jgi:hypothetical protein
MSIPAASTQAIDLALAELGSAARHRSHWRTI